MTDQDGFHEWCIVELFGHQKVAGLVSEQQIGGAAMIRVDVPGGADGRPLFTRFYGGSAIYSITPCDEMTARQAAHSLRIEPITVYLMPLPAPAVTDADGDEEDDGDDEHARF